MQEEGRRLLNSKWDRCVSTFLRNGRILVGNTRTICSKQRGLPLAWAPINCFLGTGLNKDSFRKVFDSLICAGFHWLDLPDFGDAALLMYSTALHVVCGVHKLLTRSAEPSTVVSIISEYHKKSLRLHLITSWSNIIGRHETRSSCFVLSHDMNEQFSASFTEADGLLHSISPL